MRSALLLFFLLLKSVGAFASEDHACDKVGAGAPPKVAADGQPLTPTATTTLYRGQANQFLTMDPNGDVSVTLNSIAMGDFIDVFNCYASYHYSNPQFAFAQNAVEARVTGSALNVSTDRSIAGNYAQVDASIIEMTPATMSLYGLDLVPDAKRFVPGWGVGARGAWFFIPRVRAERPIVLRAIRRINGVIEILPPETPVVLQNRGRMTTKADLVRLTLPSYAEYVKER